jgi:radical SAM superfamily enzyme YgiQ (UPF0313 family)
MQREIKRIALINPDRPLEKVSKGMAQMFEENSDRMKPWGAPSLSLLTIAALTPQEIEIDYIDERYKAIDFDKHYDLVGLTAMTHQADRAYEIAGLFRKLEVPVVMGGIHVSILPEEAAEFVDTVIVGEAEELWGVYLNDLISGKEKKYYKNEKIIDLQYSPVPRYDLLDIPLIKENQKYFHMIPIQTSRGCPHDCNFCVAQEIYGKRIRKKKVDQVIQELMYLRKYCKDSLVFFADDNMFVDKKFVKQLLKELIPLKIKYMAQTDVNIGNDPELLQLMYLSGCQIIFIGFESVVPDSLDEINTNKWKLKQSIYYSDIIRKIQDKGIVAFGGFIIGFRHDTLDSFSKIRDFIKENNIPAAFTLLTPLPGSKIRDELVAENRLLPDLNWEDYSLYNLLFRHDHFSKEEAEHSLIWLYNEVFSPEINLHRTLFLKSIYKNLSPRWIQP